MYAAGEKGGLGFQKKHGNGSGGICKVVFQGPFSSLGPRERVGEIPEESLILHLKGLTKAVSGG
jgi:ABC-type microcin C transport system duplicated ATPase subunit YejF